MRATGAGGVVEGEVEGPLGRVRWGLGAEGSGLLDVRFAVGTDGRVHGTEVHRNTSGSSEVEACVHRRIASLYFDPAPARTIERDHRFAFCADDSTDTCRLGPVVGAIDPDFAAGVRGLEAEMKRCQATRDRDGQAILSVELTVGVDGRVASGWMQRALPAGTPLADCAIAPLLNAQVTDEPLAMPRTVRFTVGLPPLSPPSVAVR